MTPLILAFVAGHGAGMVHGQGHFDAQAVSYLAMAVWAYLELTQGVNGFRRLLGLAYVVSTGVHLARALGHQVQAAADLRYGPGMRGVELDALETVIATRGGFGHREHRR